MEIGIDNSHIGKQLVICKRILHAGLLVGDNREGSDFGSGTRGGGDCNEIRLFTHLGEGVNSLADIDESHRHIHKVGFRMLVKNPHYLCGVHCGAAAESNNGIGLESTHLCGALGRIGKGRIGLDVKEGCMLNAHFVELVGYRLGVAVLIQEGIRYNKRLLCAPDGFEFVEGYGQAALFDIHLFGRSEPEHVLSPLGDCFDIEQVLYTYVFGNAVAAPGTAAERQRGSKLEVVKIADTALRGGRVNENAAGLHSG